jgi:predicted PurR-regulated permease PerM
MKRTKQRRNPTPAAKMALTLMAFGGLALFLSVFAMRNMTKIKDLITNFTDVNNKLEVLLPKLQTNVDKVSNLTKGLIPKEASAISKLLKL